MPSKGEEEALDKVGPKVAWIYLAKGGEGCDACGEKKEGWVCKVELKNLFELQFCPSCCHVLLAKLLRFYIRIMEGRGGFIIPPFTKKIEKEKEEEKEVSDNA